MLSGNSCESLKVGAEALGMNCQSPQEQQMDVDALIAVT